MTRTSSSSFTGLTPEIFRVHALCSHFLQCRHNHGLIRSIGNTVPLVGRSQNLNGRLVLIQQIGNAGGKEKLCLTGILAQNGIQECREPSFHLIQEAGGEAPQVHGYDGIFSQIRPGSTIIFGKVDTTFVFLNFGPLGDLNQITVGIRLADTTGNTAVFGNGLAQFVTNHAVAVLLIIGIVGQEV